MNRVLDDLPGDSGDQLRFRCSGLTTDARTEAGRFTAFGPPDGDYSRVCWLPVLGPTAWVLWGALAVELDGHSIGECSINDLTEALGLGRSTRLLKALKRLDRLGVASSPASNPEGLWQLPTMSPPVALRHHTTISAAARRFHHQAIDQLSGANQHLLWEIFTSTYIDHFSGHRS
jgi:hypothetical protein